MKTDQIETLLHAVRMLAHQRVDTPGLSGFERIDDGMVLAVCVVQPIVHSIELGAIESQRLRTVAPMDFA